MVNSWNASEVEQAYAERCRLVSRRGIVGFAAVDDVRLIPEQAVYLKTRLAAIDSGRGATAVVLGLLYRNEEIRAIPTRWHAGPEERAAWGRYATAYGELNALLDATVQDLAHRFGGVAEPATMAGRVDRVGHVDEYFRWCVSHRAFAERAGIGWRGRHGLIVTPEAGPALRLATVFLPGRTDAQARPLPGCGECSDCLDLCPVLRRGTAYREGCRRRIQSLQLSDEVCGLCVRICWEHVTAPGL